MPNVGMHLEQRAMSLVRPLCRRRQHLLAGEEEGQVPQQENKEDKSCVLVVEWLHGDGYVEREPRRRYMSENNATATGCRIEPGVAKTYVV